MACRICSMTVKWRGLSSALIAYMLQAKGVSSGWP
jgi:hypothetical protein